MANVNPSRHVVIVSLSAFKFNSALETLSWQFMDDNRRLCVPCNFTSFTRKTIWPSNWFQMLCSHFGKQTLMFSVVLCLFMRTLLCSWLIRFKHSLLTTVATLSLIFGPLVSDSMSRCLSYSGKTSDSPSVRLLSPVLVRWAMSLSTSTYEAESSRLSSGS